MDDDARQTIVDNEQLRLLGMFYYIRAAVTAVFSCIPIIHVIIGIVILVASSMAKNRAEAGPPAVIGGAFVVIGLAIILIGWVFAMLYFLVAKSIGRREHRTFCFIVAAIGCLSIPYGTVGSVFTFIVLSRESVRKAFDTIAPAQ